MPSKAGFDFNVSSLYMRLSPQVVVPWPHVASIRLPVSLNPLQNLPGCGSLPKCSLRRWDKNR